MSRAVQVFALGLLFALVAAGCVAFLVMSGGVSPTGSRVALVGGALLLLSGLAAAVSALGPKYRPSPLLTPLTAGIFTALVATTMVYAGYSKFETRDPAAKGTASRPVPATQAKSRATPPKPAASQTAALQPAPEAQPSQGKPVRVLDASLSPASQPPAQPPVQPSARSVVTAPAPAAEPTPAAKPADGKAATTVAVQQSPADLAKESAAAKQQESLTAASARKPAAVATAPTPKAAPPLPEPGQPLNLQTGFDTTTPAGKSAGPPLAIAAIAGQPTATPPLPRIRPCGGDGPACP